MARTGSRHPNRGLLLLLAGSLCACGSDEGRGGSSFTTAPTSASSTAPVASTGDEDDTEPADDGDESSSSGSADAESSTSTSSDTQVSMSATTTSTTTTTTTTTGVTSGDPVLDACIEMAVDECQTCGCNMCLDVLLACEMDPGCIAIRVCAENSGCTDETSCYEACQGVIEANGGVFGEPIGLAVDVAECIDNSCPICLA